MRPIGTMTIANPEKILEEVKSQLGVRQSLATITEKFQEELDFMLKNCKKSMLPFPQVCCRGWSEYNEPMDMLAIDFGGSVLKFAVINMPQCQMELKYELEIKSKVVDFKFFDNIVEWICNRIPINNERSLPRKFIVAITFSFPVNANNEIVAMGKGFRMSPELKGISILDILKQSFDRLEKEYSSSFTFEISNVINDSLAVHMTSKYLQSDNNDKISLILGTGVNSCFEVQYEDLPQFKKDILTQFSDDYREKVLINSEMGFLGRYSKSIEFGNFDTNIDDKMPLESITSGKWIPQILHNIIRYYNLLPMVGDEEIKYDGRLICEILSDGECPSEYLLSLWDYEVYQIIRQITKLLINRAAIYLVAAIIAIRKFVSPEIYFTKGGIDIDYVGSFLNYCQYYQERIHLHSKGMVKLQFLNNSNLYGCAITAYSNMFENRI